MLSLVDLYRSMYNLEPIRRDVGAEESDKTAPRLPRFSFDIELEKDLDEEAVDKKNDKVKGKTWKLNRAEFSFVGQIVILSARLLVVKDAMVVRDEKEDEKRLWVANEHGDEDKEEVLLTAVTIEQRMFERLLWCSANVHKRVAYRDRISLILEGRFNGLHGW